jgi:hypothetical protein
MWRAFGTVILSALLASAAAAQDAPPRTTPTDTGNALPNTSCWKSLRIVSEVSLVGRQVTAGAI